MCAYVVEGYNFVVALNSKMFCLNIESLYIFFIIFCGSEEVMSNPFFFNMRIVNSTLVELK